MINAQAIREKIQSSLLKDVKLGDDKPFSNPHAGEKSAVLLETRSFSESPLNSKKCCTTLTKVLFLAMTGERLTAQETTDLFFGITRLFQSTNERLRRMVYLLIKSLEVSETEVFIVTSSLTKDMNSGSDCYRANAIRVLSRIVDASMAAQIERYLKTAIVDKNPFVASSALICGLHLLKTAPEVVRRWVNEVSDSVSSKYAMVQFHALALLYELKRSDRLALQKAVYNLTRPGKSPMAECLLIRYAARTLSVERSPTLLSYIDSCLRNKTEMVMFEAAKALCELAAVDTDGHAGNSVFGTDLLAALTVLQIFLTSPKPVVRFAAVRSLNKLAQVRPHVVARCNVDMEPLLTDANRSIATLALTTLLKTGHESNVDRFIKQITSFMSEISDSFKIDIVRAVKQLCLTYPSKHKTLMAFLSSNLREEGSFDFKSDTVDALILLVQQISHAQETGLLHLCEFIEDCEYPSLCTRILAFLGEQTPTTTCPSKYIRFIYNRLILENALVRAAGVDALTKIARRCPALRRDIMALLDCCTTDNDDEVRDRTNLYYKALEVSLMSSPNSSSKTSPPSSIDLLLLGNGKTAADFQEKGELISETSTVATELASIEDLLDAQIPVSLDALCESLEIHLATSQDTIFDPTSLPTDEVYEMRKLQEAAAAAAAQTVHPAKASAAGRGEGGMGGVGGGNAGGVGVGGGGGEGPGGGMMNREGGISVASRMVSGGQGVNQEICQNIESIISSDILGTLQHSCKAQPLTEREAEYAAQVVKHMYTDFVVLEFYLTNTLQDQKLENVDVLVSGFDSTRWQILGSIPIPCLPYDHTVSAYVVLQKLQQQQSSQQDGSSLGAILGNFQSSLSFVVKEERDDIGYEDVYPIEPFSITIGNYAIPRTLRAGEFKGQWESLETQGTEIISKFSLSFKTLESAVEGLISSLNLAACDKTDRTEPRKTNHILMLSGSFLGGWQVLCKAMVVMSPEYGCLLKLACRAKNRDVCQAMMQSFE